MDVIKKKNGRKISLPQIKKYLGDEYGIDMNLVQDLSMKSKIEQNLKTLLEIASEKRS